MTKMCDFTSWREEEGLSDSAESYQKYLDNCPEQNSESISEIEFVYEPVDSYNKYGMRIKVVIKHNTEKELEEQVSKWQAFVRKKVKEQINIDRKATGKPEF